MNAKIPCTVLAAALLLGGCRTMDRLAHVGDVPPITHIQNPHEAKDYEPIRMPMPATQEPEKRTNSLWQSGARSFFKDQRASRVGDILTVNINIQKENAEFNGGSSNERENKNKLDVSGLLGLETQWPRIFKGASPANALNTTSKPEFKSEGKTSRDVTMKMDIAVTITQILPNGNFVVQGRQEARLNYEVRDIVFKGIVRPSDITAANTVSVDKVAEARISYGGRGQIDDVQSVPWGQEIYNRLAPL